MNPRMARDGRMLVGLAMVSALVLLDSRAPWAKDQAQPCVRILDRGVCIDAVHYTNARFAEFISRNGNNCEGQPCLVEREQIVKKGKAWKVAAPRFAQHPATSVTWYGAKAACEAEGARLCTDKEWDAACRGPQQTRLPYGNAHEIGRCNLSVPGGRVSSEVGSFRSCEGGVPGIFDMIGNAWQWLDACDDRRCEARGGSAVSFPGFVDCGYAERFLKTIGYRGVGFRCCRSLPR
jgi:formylglycine-generating enzyme required for sulfatase activity